MSNDETARSRLKKKNEFNSARNNRDLKIQYVGRNTTFISERRTCARAAQLFRSADLEI
jgi:hypothetical protein